MRNVRFEDADLRYNFKTTLLTIKRKEGKPKTFNRVGA